jgi:hypothetical protein
MKYQHSVAWSALDAQMPGWRASLPAWEGQGARSEPLKKPGTGRVHFPRGFVLEPLEKASKEAGRLRSRVAPLHLARAKLRRLPILASPERVAERRAICGACDSKKVDAAGELAGCQRCECGAGKMARAIVAEQLADVDGFGPVVSWCPLDKWPLLRLSAGAGATSGEGTAKTI